MLGRQQPTMSDTEQDFIEPEQARLLCELGVIATDHRCRLWIGERLATIVDTRSSIGLDERDLPQVDWLPVTPGGEIDIEGKMFAVQPFYVTRYLLTHLQFQAFLDALDGFPNDHFRMTSGGWGCPTSISNGPCRAPLPSMRTTPTTPCPGIKVWRSAGG
jgi:hypothetical protein